MDCRRERDRKDNGAFRLIRRGKSEMTEQHLNVRDSCRLCSPLFVSRQSACASVAGSALFVSLMVSVVCRKAAVSRTVVPKAVVSKQSVLVGIAECSIHSVPPLLCRSFESFSHTTTQVQHVITCCGNARKSCFFRGARSGGIEIPLPSHIARTHLENRDGTARQHFGVLLLRCGFPCNVGLL